MHYFKEAVARASLACVALVWCSFAAASESLSCDAIEMVDGNHEYNRLVCDGIELAQKKQYAEAVRKFEVAMLKRLFEYPNFELYPRLARTYLFLGDQNKAQENLSKAKLSLSVLIGAVLCQETEKGFHLINRDGSSLQESHQGEIAKRMCGGAFEYVYAQRSFESVLHDAELIETYMDVKREVESQSSPSRHR